MVDTGMTSVVVVGVMLATGQFVRVEGHFEMV